MQGRYEQAEPLLQRALAIWEQTPGSDHLNVAALLSNLAQIYGRQSKYAQAEELFQRVLRICESYLGAQHPQTAQLLSDFAAFREAQGNVLEAASLYQRALAIREAVSAPSMPKRPTPASACVSCWLPRTKMKRQHSST